jgi:integrase
LIRRALAADGAERGSGGPFADDARGNLTTSGAKSFANDAWNRLTAMNGAPVTLGPILANALSRASQGKPGRVMSENTANEALRRMRFAADEMTAHGFRAMASTLLNESGLWHPDAIERALAHRDGD